MKIVKYIALILILICTGQQTVNAQKTLKVWIVRHAEKLTDDPKDKDPDLSTEGKERAQALAKYLKGEKIDTIYATNYKRTKLTGFPLADQIGISVKTYDAAQQKELVKQLMGNARGEKIVLIGHSNTVLEIVETFGIAKPVKALTDEDYDYIFEVTVKGDKAAVKVNRYGIAHHSKEE